MLCLGTLAGFDVDVNSRPQGESVVNGQKISYPKHAQS